jgi:hypothetical protein
MGLERSGFEKQVPFRRNPGIAGEARGEGRGNGFRPTFSIPIPIPIPIYRSIGVGVGIGIAIGIDFSFLNTVQLESLDAAVWVLTHHRLLDILSCAKFEYMTLWA